MRSRAWPLHLLLAGFVAVACIYMSFLEPWGHDRGSTCRGCRTSSSSSAAASSACTSPRMRPKARAYRCGSTTRSGSTCRRCSPRSLGVSPLVSLKIVYCVFLIVCCVGCYRLLKREADEATAAFGTLLFVTSNYVIGEIFQRSAYAEFLSVALLPLLLVALQRTLLRQNRRAPAALVLLATLMILFHPLSFMNAGYAIAAYAVYVVVDRRIPYSRLIRLLPPFALALALTAFYWLPAVIETRYVMGAEGVPTPLRDTFLTLWRYLNFSSITNLGFVLTALAAAVAVGLLRRQWGHASLRSSSDAQRPSASDDGNEPWPRSSPLVAGMIVCVFLTLRMSEPLYTRVSFLAANLSVWRVLFPLTLIVTIFVTANLRALPRRLRSDLALAAIAGLAILQAMVFVLWNSAEELSARRVQVRAIEREVAVESQRKDGSGSMSICRIRGCCRGQVRRAAPFAAFPGRSVRDDLSGHAARCRFLHPHSALLESALRGVDRWPGDPGLRGPRRRDPHRATRQDWRRDAALHAPRLRKALERRLLGGRRGGGRDADHCRRAPLEPTARIGGVTGRAEAQV